jgi:acyl-coenzyme A synthetase/AMP-(fatty) acid ligase
MRAVDNSDKIFPMLIRAACDVHGDAVAISLQREDGSSETASYRELHDMSSLFARGLLARGVTKGSRIGFIIGNGPHFAIWLAAIARIGAIAIPISTMAKGAELLRIITHADLAGLIVQPEIMGHQLLDRLAAAIPELDHAVDSQLTLQMAPCLHWIASWGDELPRWCDPVDGIARAGAGVAETALERAEGAISADDQMIEIYTSGSTAAPKAVGHDHGPVMARTRYLSHMLGLEAGGEKHAALPMFWVGGLIMSLLPNWLSGVTTLCTIQQPHCHGQRA